MSEKTTYNLYSTERRYKDETLLSYYYKPNKKIIKQCSPIDIDGERYRLNLASGEITEYKKKDIIASYKASLRRTKIAMNMLLTMNEFHWFWTLTFDNEKINRYDDKKVFDCYERYIHNLSRQFPETTYMCFPERHEDGCIHFHLLVGNISPKQMGLVNSGKVCCHWAMKNGKKLGYCSREYYEKTKHLYELTDTDGEIIYNITTFAYGFTTASRICSPERCKSYVKKYVEKALGSTEIFKKRFYYSRNLNIPDVVKQIIGAEFDAPIEFKKLSCMQNNPLIKNSTEIYLSEYGVLQAKIDNKIKDLIDSGFIPADAQDLLFDENEQLSF